MQSTQVNSAQVPSVEAKKCKLLSGLSEGCRNLTGFSLIRDDLVNAGGEYRLERVVVDRNLVTAQHAGDLPRFLAAFLRLVA